MQDGIVIINLISKSIINIGLYGTLELKMSQRNQYLIDGLPNR
jgi:hypothetical protein